PPATMPLLVPYPTLFRSPAVLGQQLPHLDDVVFIAPALIGALLEHVGPAGRTDRPARPWRATHAHARSAHAWSCRTRTHRSTGRYRKSTRLNSSHQTTS